MIKQRPSPSTPREFRFPAFERSVLSNGMRLIVAPMHRLPVVTSILVIDGGASLEVAGQEGVADIVARALAEGTRTKSADELVMALERMGTSISASADWESTILKMTVLTPNLEKALVLMSEMIADPAFDDESIDRLRAERVSEIVQTRSEARVLADEAFAATLYDPEARYAIPVGGSESSVAAITVNDVRTYHAKTYNPPAVTLILAGDVSRDGAQKIAAKTFGEWTSTPATLSTGGRSVDKYAGEKRIRVVGRAGAQQSELRVGHTGAPRSLSEYFAVVVMNAVLGGLFSSRINLNLREAHGYTYGASSYFDWRQSTGPFVISSAVQSEVTGAAVTEVINEINRIRAEEISEDELTLATSYLAGVFPIRYETSDAVASGLASLVVFGLADDYFTSYRTKILGVTTGDVQEAARKFLRPGELSIVVAGSPEIIEPQLSALNIGPVLTAAEFA